MSQKFKGELKGKYVAFHRPPSTSADQRRLHTSSRHLSLPNLHELPQIRLVRESTVVRAMGVRCRRSDVGRLPDRRVHLGVLLWFKD